MIETRRGWTDYLFRFEARTAAYRPWSRDASFHSRSAFHWRDDVELLHLHPYRLTGGPQYRAMGKKPFRFRPRTVNFSRPNFCDRKRQWFRSTHDGAIDTVEGMGVRDPGCNFCPRIDLRRSVSTQTSNMLIVLAPGK